MLIIFWRVCLNASEADAPVTCARTAGVPAVAILRASFLASTFELEGDLRRYGKPTTTFFHVVSVAGVTVRLKILGVTHRRVYTFEPNARSAGTTQL